MSEKVTMHWHCDTCGDEGSYEFRATETLRRVIAYFNIIHHKASPFCSGAWVFGSRDA